MNREKVSCCILQPDSIVMNSRGWQMRQKKTKQNFQKEKNELWTIDLSLLLFRCIAWAFPLFCLCYRGETKQKQHGWGGGKEEKQSKMTELTNKIVEWFLFVWKTDKTFEEEEEENYAKIFLD